MCATVVKMFSCVSLFFHLVVCLLIFGFLYYFLFLLVLVVLFAMGYLFAKIIQNMHIPEAGTGELRRGSADSHDTIPQVRATQLEPNSVWLRCVEISSCDLLHVLCLFYFSEV